MKKAQFTEEQILGILKQVEGGRKIAAVCREHGSSYATYHRWKAKYGGLEVSQLRRLKQLEDENRKLKQLVGELTLDNAALKDVVAKKRDRQSCPASRRRDRAPSAGYRGETWWTALSDRGIPPYGSRGDSPDVPSRRAGVY